MNSILVESWDSFKVSAGKVIMGSFAKTNILPLRPPELTTNTQAFSTSVQVSSGDKSEEINEISLRTVAYI